MPREEIGDGVRVGDRCANTGPSTKFVLAFATGTSYGTHHPRRPLTLDEAERGDIPKSFSKEEWAAMLQASKYGTV